MLCCVKVDRVALALRICDGALWCVELTDWSNYQFSAADCYCLLSDSPPIVDLGAPVKPVLASDRRNASTAHVVRYVSAHASTWPEYERTRRTLDRSTARCTSLSRSLNASAVVPTVGVRQEREGRPMLGSSGDVELLGRPPRPSVTSSGTTLSGGHCMSPVLSSVTASAWVQTDSARRLHCRLPSLMSIDWEFTTWTFKIQ